MIPAKYYETTECNFKITHKHTYFNPKGVRIFRAVITYKFGDITDTVEFENTHKINVKKFIKWSQPLITEFSNSFYKKVTAIRLEALLTSDTSLHQQLLDTPIEGHLDAYVVR